jgi:hypothetical protein
MSIETIASTRPRAGGLLKRYFARFEEGRIIRAAFFGMLIGTLGVLGLDLKDLVEENGGFFPNEATSPTAVTVPVLPPAVETTDAVDGGADPRKFIRTEESLLREPIRFALEAGGVLKAVGSIDPGAAQRFAEEVAARGEYVRTISLNSPGGSLEDAMAMARLIRKEGFATEVADGAICASSCPLVLAGGLERHVGDRAAIGLHQFYAITRADTAPAQAMADAQMTTARISRLLTELDVDPALWLHALDTPPRALYYLSADQMRKYRLVTDAKLALRGGTGEPAVFLNR